MQRSFDVQAAGYNLVSMRLIVIPLLLMVAVVVIALLLSTQRAGDALHTDAAADFSRR